MLYCLEMLAFSSYPGSDGFVFFACLHLVYKLKLTDGSGFADLVEELSALSSPNFAVFMNVKIFQTLSFCIANVDSSVWITSFDSFFQRTILPFFRIQF